MGGKAIHQSSKPYKAKDYDFSLAKDGNMGKAMYLYTDGSGVAKAKSHGHKFTQEVDVSQLRPIQLTQRQYDKYSGQAGSKQKFNDYLVSKGYDSIVYTSAGHKNNIAIIDPATVKNLSSGKVTPIKP